MNKYTLILNVIIEHFTLLHFTYIHFSRIHHIISKFSAKWAHYSNPAASQHLRSDTGVRHVGDSRMGRVPDIFCRSSNESTAYLILVIIRQQSPKQWGRISLAFSLSSGCVRCVKRFRCLSCPWKWRQHFWLISQKSSCSFDCIQILPKKRKLVAYYIFTYGRDKLRKRLLTSDFVSGSRSDIYFFQRNNKKTQKAAEKCKLNSFVFFFFFYILDAWWQTR